MEPKVSFVINTDKDKKTVRVTILVEGMSEGLSVSVCPNLGKPKDNWHEATESSGEVLLSLDIKLKEHFGLYIMKGEKVLYQIVAHLEVSNLCLHREPEWIAPDYKELVPTWTSPQIAMSKK